MPTNNQVNNQQSQQDNQNQAQQAQANNQANNNPNSTFDVNNLPPEFQRYVDQQRTQASQTARNNARNELMHDESFLNEVRTGMQGQVQKTVEEQLADLRRETQMDRSSAKVERILAGANIPEAQIPTYLDMLVTEDVDASVAKANSFVAAFNEAVQNGVKAEQQKAMGNVTTPQTPQQNSQVTEQERLQSLFDEAKKETSPSRKGIRISSIMREAQEKGIILK